MKIKFTRTPTFTKSIIAAAVFAIIYLASGSNLPSCSDTIAALNSSGGCIERQSFLHTASGWLALICLVAAAVLLALKHKDAILGRQAPAEQVGQAAPAPAPAPAPVLAPAPARPPRWGASWPTRARGASGWPGPTGP